MRINSLSLTNFRNFARLELRFADRVSIFRGANAQGKTNLLEAIHLLATGRSTRAGAERELINWLALDGPLSYARLECAIGEGREEQKIEMVLELSSNGVNGGRVQKRVRVNGVQKRALDLVGRLRVVMFLPEDVNLVAGAPGERRRYLDIALCQIAPSYCHALGEYNRSVSQRNALLKQLREHGGDRDQLKFWNARLAEFGSVLSHRRAAAIRELDRIAAERHLNLSGGLERLALAYMPSPDPAHQRRVDPLNDRSGRAGSAPRAAPDDLDRSGWHDLILRQLQGAQTREIAAGSSLFGPHRDDFSFAVDDRDLRTYGSRGQQRTAALALKLAELQMMRDETEDQPLLLLDDVMSELDVARRMMLVEALSGLAQAVVTTTDWADFGPDLLVDAGRYEVVKGCISPIGR